MNLRIRDIYSYGKLTGQGITLMGGDIVRILESALPQRFGGGPGDYQLVEYDGARQAQLELRISPRAGAGPPAAVRDFLLREIRGCYGGALASRVWTHSGGLEAVDRRTVRHAQRKSASAAPAGYPKAEAAHAS